MVQTPLIKNAQEKPSPEFIGLSQRPGYKAHLSCTSPVLQVSQVTLSSSSHDAAFLATQESFEKH